MKHAWRLVLFFVNMWKTLVGFPYFMCQYMDDGLSFCQCCFQKIKRMQHACLISIFCVNIWKTLFDFPYVVSMYERRFLVFHIGSVNIWKTFLNFPYVVCKKLNVDLGKPVKEKGCLWWHLESRKHVSGETRKGENLYMMTRGEYKHVYGETRKVEILHFVTPKE